MASKSLLVSASISRVLALIFLGASMAVLVTNKVKLSDGSSSTFKDIISSRFLVGSTVGAGLAVALDLKKLLKEPVDILEALGCTGLEDDESRNDKFQDRASVAIGILFLAFLCMALLSISTSILRKPSTRSLFA